MKDVDAIIKELEKFAPGVANLNDPVDLRLVDEFELKYEVKLPDDYKYALTKANGFSVMGDEVYGIDGTQASSSLEDVYKREHNEVKFPQFPYLVPFSDDGGGNFYCFDTRYHTNKGNSCPIIFWVSNYYYTVEDAPEVVYESFVDFVNEVLIAWTLRDYDYEGNEK